MDTAHIKHLGALRTEATHVRSGSTILTDAPVDNKGRGEAFSPTDLLATALATCMITTMEIVANGRGFELKVLDARVVKHMASNPRRVERVGSSICKWTETDWTRNGASCWRPRHMGCPVARERASRPGAGGQFTYR